MPRDEDDWSDSDDEALSDLETSVLLGVPDGPIEEPKDLRDAAVSRIGGHAAFLTSDPRVSSSHCKNCSKPMELLVQVWCPFEDSPMDRSLYVWGCAESGCQRKEGSVRAWRNLRRNIKYAAKLNKKKAREQKQNVAKEVPKSAAPKINPFATSASDAPNPFGLGSQVFGSAPPTPPATLASAPSTEDESPDDAPVDEEEELLTAMAATTLEDSGWPASPAYPALYLSTMSEYLPPAPKAKSKLEVDDDPDDAAASKGGFAPEGYENSLNTDHVFDRFSSRVSVEPSQCLRYELDGKPIPFGSGAVFDRLFPVPKASVTVIGNTGAVATAPTRAYTDASVPPCEVCGGKRVFECQLMPNLINVTAAGSARTTEKQTDAERRAALQASLEKRGGGRGMEWGTCMIFSCAKDCGKGDSWLEEAVLVQWED